MAIGGQGMSGTLAAPAASEGPLGPIARFLRSDLFARLASYLFLLAVWQLVALYEDRFPGPAETFGFLWIEVTGGAHGGVVRGQFLEHFAATLPRFGLGIAISMVLGVVTGVVIGGSKLAEALLKDTLLVLVALPAIIWAFLTQMWWGLGDFAVVITTFLSAFPFVAVNVVQGIQAIPRDLRRMSGAYHVPLYRRLRHMQIPAVTGYLFAGFRFAVIIGWNAVLLAEWFSASEGVGWRARYWYDANRYKGFVGWVILFIAFIVLLDRLVLVRLQRRAFLWRDAQLSATERQAEEIEVGITGA
jgi:ABC-type nitrate/sulfonate/bicarbonate transport system permease component